MTMKRPLALFGGDPLFPDPLYLTRPAVPSMKEILPALEDILKSRWLTNNGPYLRKFEAALREFFGVPGCAVFANGTLALNLAVQALGLTGEVITTPFTFPATTHVLHWNGITPVFCDIDPETFNLDPSRLESLISPATTAVLPVHVFGNPCDTRTIERIAEKHGLKVLYDAAHAFGVELAGHSIAACGDASMFSFHATKIFNTLEGGAVTCRDESILQSLRDLRNFGIRGEEEVAAPGINAKMNEFQAAFGLANLPKVAETIRKRKKRYLRYVEPLSNLPGIVFQSLAPGHRHNYAHMPILIVPEEFGLTRDELYAGLRAEGILVRKYFFPLTSRYDSYRHLPSADPDRLATAHIVSKRILCLPLYEDLAIEDIDAIVERLTLLRREAGPVRKALMSGNSG